MKFNRIKIILAEREMKSRDLANKLGVTDATVSRWCSNDSQPKPEMFIEIARVLNVDVRDLLYRTTRYDVRVFNAETKELLSSDLGTLPDKGQEINLSLVDKSSERIIRGPVKYIDEFNTGDEFHIKADVYIKVLEDYVTPES